MRKVLIFVLFVALLFSLSCNKGEVYFKFQQIDRGIWRNENKLEFVLDSLPFDPTSNYNVQLEVIYTNLYPYNNLWLTVYHNLTDTVVASDTLELLLIDENGNRLGSGNVGLYQFSIPYKSSIHLDSASIYTLQIGNLMQDDQLIGVDKIGVKVQNSDKY